MTVRRALRPLVAVVALAALTGLAGCEQSAEEKRSAYCAQVKDDSDDLTRITDEGGAAAFLEALPILERLSDKSPSDLKDEWQTFLNGLYGLEDAMNEAALEPEELDEGLPKGMDPADRKRVTQAANFLQDPRVVTAAQGIEQHALDVCDTPIL